MIGSSLVFLTPQWALIGLVGILPLASAALASRRERRARVTLGLSAPERAPGARRASAITAVAVLLGLAASQPVIRSTTSVHVRTDAEAFFVIDISRSMLASRAPGATTRIAAARAAAIQLRESLLDIPSGVATLTDHVLPDLMPAADPSVFEQTVRKAVQVDQPPPATNAVTATDLGALGALGTQNFFSPTARHRIAIVLTDGESRPFDVGATARALAHSPGVTPIFVQFWSPSDAVFGPGDRPESAYHPDPASGQALAALAEATHGWAFTEHELGAAARVARSALGSGPTTPVGISSRTTALAPYAALAALVPLLLLISDGLASLTGASSLFARRRATTGEAVDGSARTAETRAPSLPRV